MSVNAPRALGLTLDQTRWDTLSPPSMHSADLLARALSNAFLRGAWTADELNRRGSQLLGRRWRWIRPLAQRVVNQVLGSTPPRRADLARLILRDAGFVRAVLIHDLRIADWLTGSNAMRPAEAAVAWHPPSICTVDELAVWLDTSRGDLEWFANRRRLDPKQHRERLSHYRYRPVYKRFGQVRLIEAPKPRLKAIQRRILEGILDRIPPHAAALGFRRGGSIGAFAAPHVGQNVVLKIDLQDFFPSISLARVRALFLALGYPETVADLLAGLCTNATPQEVWEHVELPRSEPPRAACWRYSRSHLPQGAPSSPALANLCAYRLDCRLRGLADVAGGTYTRHADDLAFSGGEEFERCIQRFQLHACAIVMEEGFAVHNRKTRIMRRGVRQQLAGLVLNEHLNVRRDDYDRLKAILTNCIRHGAQSQNLAGHPEFRLHLQGRIAFVKMINPGRAKKLGDLFQRIAW